MGRTRPSGVAIGGGLLAAVVVIGAGVIAWRVGEGVVVPVPYGLQPEFEVLGVAGTGGTTVRLPAPPPNASQFSRTEARGRYGLMWEVAGGIGHGQLGPVGARGDGWVERPLDVVVGPPPQPGTPARLDVTLHRRDPLADHGVPFEEVWIVGPVGEIAGWFMERNADTAVVMVHGRRRGDRTEALRALPSVLAHGTSVLVTSYRNHDASAPSSAGLFTYGQDESDDLLAAIAWLADRGVERVVIVSYSMGGAIALLARERWPDRAPELLGIAMDSPLLDPREVVRLAVRRAGLPLPGLAADLGLAVAGWRAGVRWAPLDLRRLAPGLDLPVLLIGAVEDGTIPIDLLDDFARLAPADSLEYWRVEGAGHVEAYNVDPAAYEARLGTFLERTLTR
ncbi:hypothetical protein BH23DEI1_BH23DEI1_10510 [soil metagenome]